jgi:hypothetical protein
MASEVQIREAIRARIEAFTASLTPPPIVVSRDLGDGPETETVNDLRDSNGHVHCIIVTQDAAIPDDPANNDGFYNLWFNVTQYTQYRSGADTTNPAIPLNSDDAASIEREKIIDAFRDSNALEGVLKGAGPITFPRGSIGPFKPGFNTQIRQAKAQLRVINSYGCQ